MPPAPTPSPLNYLSNTLTYLIAQLAASVTSGVSIPGWLRPSMIMVIINLRVGGGVIQMSWLKSRETKTAAPLFH